LLHSEEKIAQKGRNVRGYYVVIVGLLWSIRNNKLKNTVFSNFAYRCAIGRSSRNSSDMRAMTRAIDIVVGRGKVDLCLDASSEFIVRCQKASLCFKRKTSSSKETVSDIKASSWRE
jgi:hypothetical protein